MPVVLNANEYFTGWVNWILFLRLYALNKSKREKTITDVFCTETLEYGDRKAFPFAEIPAVGDYSLTSSLLSDSPIHYSQEFIGDPIKKKIPLTRIEPFLKMASMSADGQAMLNGYILGLMESAKEDYLYNIILDDLFSWTPNVTAGKEMEQTAELIPETGVTDAIELNAIELHNQKKIELAWQKTFDDFEIYTDVFLDVNNAANDLITGNPATNFKSALNLDDLIFIGNGKFLNERTVNLMATLLKSEVISGEFRRPPVLKIPQRSVEAHGAGSVIGFVAHKHWYQWFYHFMFMGSFLDIDTVRIKNVLHFWYSQGILRNLPVMKLEADYTTPPSP